MSEPHTAGPFAVRSSNARARIRQAVMELAIGRGLERTDVAAVVERAGVDRASFDRNFEDLRDCCSQIYLANVAEFDRVVLSVGDGADPWRDRLRAVAYAAAGYVRDRPVETRFDMVQMLAAEGSAQAYRDRYVARIVDLIDEGRQELGDPDSIGRNVAEGIFGSIYELILREIQAGRGTGLAEELVPEMMYIAVRPYLGHQAALRELEADANPNKAR